MQPMDPSPDWLFRWLATKAMELGISWFWKKYGKDWYISANRELLKLAVWYWIMRAEILDSMAQSSGEQELVPAADHDAELEELPEALRRFVPRRSFAFGINSNLIPKIDPFANIRNIIKDSLKVRIPRLRYVPYSFRYVPPKVSYRPLSMRYKPMGISFVNGFPQFVPARIDYEPPRFEVKPASFDFSPGGFRLTTG